MRCRGTDINRARATSLLRQRVAVAPMPSRYRKGPRTYSRARSAFYERSATSRKSFQRDEILSQLETPSSAGSSFGRTSGGRETLAGTASRVRVIRRRRKGGEIPAEKTGHSLFMVL